MIPFIYILYVTRKRRVTLTSNMENLSYLQALTGKQEQEANLYSLDEDTFQIVMDMLNDLAARVRLFTTSHRGLSLLEEEKKRFLSSLPEVLVVSAMTKEMFTTGVHLFGAQEIARMLFDAADRQTAWSSHVQGACVVLVPDMNYYTVETHPYPGPGMTSIGPDDDVEFGSDNFLSLSSQEGENDGESWMITGIHRRDDGMFIGIDGSAGCDYTGFD
jgi:hypothetical protein